MHVTCPSCHTTYRLPEVHRRRRRPAFECTRCGRVFEPAVSHADWDDDDPFVMDDDDARARGLPIDGEPDETAGADLEIDDDEDFDPAADFEIDAVEEENLEEEDEDDDEANDDGVDAPARGGRRRRSTGRGAGQKRSRAQRGSGRGRSSPTRFAVRSLLAVVIFYAVVGIWMTTFPESARAAMQRIPLVGTSLARRPLGPGQMALGDVQATLEPLAGSGGDDRALVVVATVTNHASVSAEAIDLAIDLEADTPRRERRTCTGALLNVTPFKRGELELMTGYNRSRVARIAPGESVTCQSIFLDYPAGLRAVRVRVVGAQGR